MRTSLPSFRIICPILWKERLLISRSAFGFCSLYCFKSTYKELKAHEDELGIHRPQIAYLIVPESTPLEQLDMLSKEYKLLFAH